MRKILFFLGFFHFIYGDFSTTFEYALSEADFGKEEIFWEVLDLTPFDELILSWNAPRTREGDYAFFVSLRQEGEWSPFLYYGDWGVRGQMLTGESPPDCFVKTGRGVAILKRGTCDAFRIQVMSAGEGKLSQMDRLWACVSNLSQYKSSSIPSLDPVLLAPLNRQSIYTLRLPRHWDMTMVATMRSTIRYLGGNEGSAEDFAAHIMDGDYECYDFWPLHAAEAYDRLAGTYHVHIERLSDFAALHAYLKKGTPVLVNIQGTPTGGFMWPSYRSHILSIIGYDPEKKMVHCIDPIFPSDKSTYVSYPADDFIRLWGKKGNIACVFTRRFH